MWAWSIAGVSHSPPASFLSAAPPRIDRMPAELNLPEGENTKIKVFYSGDQPMDISLTFGGKPVSDGGRVKLTVFDEFLIIYIKEVAKSDAGMYTLTCKNDSGVATGNFTVNITGGWLSGRLVPRISNDAIIEAHGSISF